MLIFPNAKINIGLQITGKRPDGYHNLETIFYPLALTDALEFVEVGNNTSLPLLVNTGLAVKEADESNLVIKAYRLMQQKYNLPQLSIHLHKTIPFGAGLGGGSANAAFMITALNKHFKLGLNTQTLIEFATQLGSDCPFFIINQPCFATGRGEILNTIDLNLSQYYLMLVKPNIHISTAQAFEGIKPENVKISLPELIKTPIEQWACLIQNHFETHLFETYPVLSEIKNELYKYGAIYASMSGSGSTIYGIFKTEPIIDFPTCFVWKGKMM